MQGLTIAVASGKGGTGKTTFSTNLALALSRNNKKTEYIDCDVEEPNGFIFLNPEIKNATAISIDVPQPNLDKCTGCGICGKFCKFSAIVSLNKNVLVFEELCHSCNGCITLCPANALEPKSIEVGLVEQGTKEDLTCAQGILKISSARTPTLISSVRKLANNNAVTILDAPPGTACAAVASLKDVDFVLLVTEPTPFGLNDLKLAVDMTRKLGIPFAVAINRCDIGNDETLKYCDSENIPVIMEIKESKQIAHAYSQGKMIIDVLPEYQDEFSSLYDKIITLIKEAANA